MLLVNRNFNDSLLPIAIKFKNFFTLLLHSCNMYYTLRVLTDRLTTLYVITNNIIERCCCFFFFFINETN